MEQTYDCCPVLTEFVLLDNVVSHLGAPRDILAASHGEGGGDGRTGVTCTRPHE